MYDPLQTLLLDGIQEASVLDGPAVIEAARVQLDASSHLDIDPDRIIEVNEALASGLAHHLAEHELDAFEGHLGQELLEAQSQIDQVWALIMSQLLYSASSEWSSVGLAEERAEIHRGTVFGWFATLVESTGDVGEKGRFDDYDGDGILNCADKDDDNDGVPDKEDDDPWDSTRSITAESEAGIPWFSLVMQVHNTYPEIMTEELLVDALAIQVMYGQQAIPVWRH
jgi:hypothetical protein